MHTSADRTSDRNAAEPARGVTSERFTGTMGARCEPGTGCLPKEHVLTTRYVTEHSFDLVGNCTTDHIDIGDVFAQASVAQGDHVWLGYVSVRDEMTCRVRISSAPVHSGGDGPRLVVAFNEQLLREYTVVNEAGFGGAIVADEARWRTYRIPLRATASRVASMVRGDRIVALGVLAWVYGRSPDGIRKQLENRAAAGGRRAVRDSLRLFEAGWRGASGWMGRRFLLAPTEAEVAPTEVEVAPTEALVAPQRIVNGREALIRGALRTGMHDAVVASEHRQAEHLARTFAAAGGRIVPPTLALSAVCEPILAFETDAEAASGRGQTSNGFPDVYAPRVTLRLARLGTVRTRWRGAQALSVAVRKAADGAQFAAYPVGSVVFAPTTVAECFHFIGLARRLALQRRCEVTVLIDGLLLGAVAKGSDLDAERCEPAGAEAWQPVGGAEGDVLLVGWGATRGPVEEAVGRLRTDGRAVSALHLPMLSPLPRHLSSTLRRFRHIVVVDVATETKKSIRRGRQLLRGLHSVLATRHHPKTRGGFPHLSNYVFSGAGPLGPGSVVRLVVDDMADGGFSPRATPKI